MDTVTKEGACMVSEEEQIDFFNTIFAPLRESLSSKCQISSVIQQTSSLKVFGQQIQPEYQDWNTESLDETELESWKWLIGIRKAHPSTKVNGIDVHKFVWHKKPNEAGWVQTSHKRK